MTQMPHWEPMRTHMDATESSGLADGWELQFGEGGGGVGHGGTRG